MRLRTLGSRKCNVHLAIRTHSCLNQPRQASPHRNSKGDGNGGDDGIVRGTPTLICESPSGKANRLPCFSFKQDSCQKGNFCICWHILECKMQISTGMQVRRQSVFYCWTYSAIVGSLNFRIVSSSSGTNSFLLIRWSEALESTMSFSLVRSSHMRWDEMRSIEPRMTRGLWSHEFSHWNICTSLGQSKLASGKHWPSSSLDQVTQLQSSLRSRTLSDRDIDDFRHCLQSGFFMERGLLMRGEEALLAELKTKQYVSVIWTC